MYKRHKGIWRFLKKDVDVILKASNKHSVAWIGAKTRHDYKYFQEETLSILEPIFWNSVVAKNSSTFLHQPTFFLLIKKVRMRMENGWTWTNNIQYLCWCFSDTYIHISILLSWQGLDMLTIEELSFFEGWIMMNFWMDWYKFVQCYE